MRQRLVTGLAVVVGVALSVTGCTTAPGTGGGSTTKPATEVLTDAVTKTTGQSFKYTLSYGTAVSGDGYQDATGANATRNVTFTDAASGLKIKANVVLAAGLLYAKIDLGAITSSIPGLGGIANKWLAVDKAKVGTTGLAASLVPTAESVNAATFVSGVATAERVSDTEIKGTIDLAKAAPKFIPTTEFSKLTAEQKLVPFTATLDSQGRITKMVLKMPALASLPAVDLVTSYSDYGATVEVAKPPAAETVPMPETFYLFLK